MVLVFIHVCCRLSVFFYLVNVDLDLGCLLSPSSSRKYVGLHRSGVS